MALEKWSLTDHICRNCFGRILERQKGGRKKHFEHPAQPRLDLDFPDGVAERYEVDEPVKVFRCADCGQRVVSNDHRDICCCGIGLKDGTDIRVRCVHSRETGAACQTEIVAKQVNDGK